MWQKILHKFLKFPYILNVHEYQSPKKPAVTVLLLHGIGSSLWMWQDVAAKLPKDARIIAVDLLGFGKSPKPEWSVYGAKTQADSLATTLFSRKIVGPVVVVGHSLGSLIAIEFARRYPLMTKSLVLISPPLYKPDRDIATFEARPEEVLRRMYALLHSNPDATERILRMAGKYRLINKGFNAEHVNVVSYLATLNAAIINQTSYNDIFKIKPPVHIISGKFDSLVLDSTLKEISATRPRTTWKSVVGTHEIVGRVRTATISAIKLAIDDERADRRIMPF